MLKQMQYFIKIVEKHSFTRAAEECLISQSAISQQIKALEEELDVKLYIKNQRSFRLTSAGEYFYSHCIDIVRSVDELTHKIKDIEDNESTIK